MELIGPVCVTLPEAVTDNVPVAAVPDPNSVAPSLSSTETFVPFSVIVLPNVESNSSSRIDPPVEVSDVTPVTTSLSLSVMVLLATTVNVVAVIADKSVELRSVIETVVPLSASDPKLFVNVAEFNRICLVPLPATIVARPVAVTPPICDTSPAAVTVNVPVALVVPSTVPVAFLSLIAMFVPFSARLLVLPPNE